MNLSTTAWNLLSMRIGASIFVAESEALGTNRLPDVRQQKSWRLISAYRPQCFST
jgi:hypothetical protein